MTPADRREQVRDAARYLRSVRPLDPTELTDYVDGDVDADDVRADLYDMALDLDIVEGADGTFTPTPTGPVPEPGTPFPGFPPRYEVRLESLLTNEYGADWATGDTGDRLRSTIDDLKTRYFHRRGVEYDTDTAYAYAIYHLANYYVAGYHLLADLARDSLLDHTIRLLDVGAGVGGPALGMFDALPRKALVDYHAVEPGDGTTILEALLEETGVNVHPTIHDTTAEAFDLDAEFDLVVLGNVLSELEDPVATVARYLDAVDEHGTMTLVAPADQETSTELRRVERTIVDDRGLATVYAPTVRLWPNEHPTDRGWSFIRHPDIDVPSYQAELARGDSTYRHKTVQYSYTHLRCDDRRRIDVTLSPDAAAKMSGMETHVTNRIDVVAAKLSPDLGTEHPLYKVSDGSESTDHYAVLVHESPLTEALATAEYGALLSLENVLVLWNDDEAGYNLVVDDESVVDYY